MEENGFSLYEQTEYTNQELLISYTPKASITRYTYDIIKDGKVYETYQVTGNKTSEILLFETGNYQIVVTTYQGRKETKIESGNYLLDMEKPIIRLKDTNTGNILTVEKPFRNQTVNLNDYIIAYDAQDGDLSHLVTSNSSSIDFTKLGLQELTYTVSDKAGNITEQTIRLNLIANKQITLWSIQISIVAILTIVIGFFLRYRKSIRLEKRISKYSVQALKDNSLSMLEKLSLTCQKWNQKLSKSLSKSAFLKKYSRHYEKYVPLYLPFYQTGMDFIATKLFIGFVFIVIAIVSKAIQYQVMEVYEWLIPFIFGLYLPDLLFFSKYKIYRNTLENDLLQAIIIMNNAFKSGRSIRQAIDLVTKELTGPIAEEFKKMSLEISFGLSIEETFKRFSERIQLEEVAYLTASLSILNRTGGNIIQVFSSIEKSLFNKKKLKLELASLTGSSKIVAYMLCIMPLLFIVFITLINPSYFVPLYTTNLGLILSGLILVIYICYIFLVRKIMRVRM